jgi:hypothetical protein
MALLILTFSLNNGRACYAQTGTTSTSVVATISSPAFPASEPATITVQVGCNLSCGYVDYIEEGV